MRKHYQMRERCFFPALHVFCDGDMLRSAVLRHTSRGILHPSADRYIAIRRFFINQTRNNAIRFNHSDSKPPPDVNQKPAEPHSHLPPLNLDNYPRLYRRLALSLSHLHRPTKDDFLKVANGFWQRLRIRFKWFTIRSFRKFNADDISAFVTWFLMSQTLWILVGT